MVQASDLVKPLAERGIVLSREQTCRMVTTPPQRLLHRSGWQAFLPEQALQSFLLICPADTTPRCQPSSA